VTRYLVERYIPGDSVEDVRAAVARLVAAVAEMAAAGAGVRYVRSTVIWTDETCFCELEGDSVDVVAEANDRARFAYARIAAMEQLVGATADLDT
jgi:hypothetical protein